MENKQKYIFIGLGILLVILLVVSASLTSEKKDGTAPSEVGNILENAQNESAAAEQAEKKEFTEINVDKYLEYIAGSEAKIILFARPTCQYCQIAEPILKVINKVYDLEINYVNTDEFTEDDQKRVLDSDEFFNDGFGTPLLLVVKDNKIVDKVDGLTDTAHYVEFFTNNGFIKE